MPGTSPLKPMRRVLVSDEIIDHIKNLIIEGQLKPGEKLPSEIKMASQMKVGRSTIREALKVLIHLGLIVRKNRLTYVAENLKNGRVYPDQLFKRFKDYRNLFDMIEVRKILEPDVAEMAANRCDPSDVKQMEKDVNCMADTIDDLEAFLLHDHHFHVHIAQAAKNSVIIEIIKGIQDMLVKTQGHIIRESLNIRNRSLDYHTNIYESIKTGKPKTARKQMLDHILDIEKEMYAILKS